MARSVQIPLFPIPLNEVDRKREVQTMLNVLTMPNRFFSVDATTVFINIFRFFVNNINDDKLIEAMEKQNSFTGMKTSETFQDWAKKYVQRYHNTTKKYFENDVTFSKTQTGISIVLCCFAHKTFQLNDVWYVQLLEDATKEFGTSTYEFTNLFNVCSLRTIYFSLWSRGSRGQLLPPYTLRHFLINEIIAPHNIGLENEVGKVLGFVKTKLSYFKMAGFKIVQVHLLDHCPRLHTWKHISADMVKFGKIYKKFEAMETLGPFARVVLSPEESAEFNPMRYFKLVAAAVAIGLEHDCENLLKYAPKRMFALRGYINETRQLYKNMMSAAMASSVPMFPIPVKEEERRRDLQTMLNLLTVSKKISPMDAATVFINIFRFFFRNINEDKLIEAMEKQERFTAMKTAETFQDWVQNKFQPYFGTCKNKFENDTTFNKTLTGISIVLCCLAHKSFEPDDVWYAQLLDEVTKEFGRNKSEFTNLFNISSLHNTYVSLWSRGVGGQLLPPYTLRHFIMTKIASRNKGSDEEVRKVVGFVKNKLLYIKMVGFNIVRVHLMERGAVLHTWKRISADMIKFDMIYKKFKAMGTLGPYARVVLSPEESEEFSPDAYIRLVAVAVALGLERNCKTALNYAPVRMNDFRGFINETRQYYKKMRRSELTSYQDGIVDYDDTYAF